MLFAEALALLQEGKYVCRPMMKELCEYLVFMPGMLNIWMIKTQPNANAGNWLPTVLDLEANDWELIERLATPVEPPLA